MRELFNFVARPNFAKRKSRSPRGFLPRPLLRAGESALAPRLLFPRHFVAGCGFIFEKSSRECYNDTTKEVFAICLKVINMVLYFLERKSIIIYYRLF